MARLLPDEVWTSHPSREVKLCCWGCAREQSQRLLARPGGRIARVPQWPGYIVKCCTQMPMEFAPWTGMSLLLRPIPVQPALWVGRGFR